MKRILFNLSAGVSLLLCLGVIVLWARSYWVCDQIVRYYQSEITMQSMHGSLSLMELKQNPSLRRPMWIRDTFPARKALQGPLAELFGFRFYLHGTVFNWIVPHWFPALLFAVLPLWRMLRPGRRWPEGHCPTCGYDLRATPQQCPECGSIPESAKEATA